MFEKIQPEMNIFKDGSLKTVPKKSFAPGLSRAWRQLMRKEGSGIAMAAF
jgi:hypothetical protein